MRAEELRRIIKERSGGVDVAIQSTTAGIVLGVPSSKPNIYHWSLIPIDPDSHARFIDFMCSLVRKDKGETS